MIQIRNLSRVFQMGDTEIRAIDDISFEVNKGDMLAITGSSGSGKSTLMNILGCLDLPDRGDYILDGVHAGQLSGNQLATIRNQKIGFIFQTFNLLGRMSALENVELPLLYAGLRDTREKALSALEQVGLADRVHHHPNQMSGGQRQRVAIARAIVNEPAILLADEPTGNLDSKTSEEILAIFQDLNAAGRTVLMVTHEEDIARRCRQRLHMSDGKIVSRS